MDNFCSILGKYSKNLETLYLFLKKIKKNCVNELMLKQVWYIDNYGRDGQNGRNGQNGL